MGNKAYGKGYHDGKSEGSKKGYGAGYKQAMRDMKNGPQEDDDEFDDDDEEDYDDPGTYAHCSDWEDSPEECYHCGDDDCPLNADCS
jgi:hypothetical protein